MAQYNEACFARLFLYLVSDCGFIRGYSSSCYRQLFCFWSKFSLTWDPWTWPCRNLSSVFLQIVCIDHRSCILVQRRKVIGVQEFLGIWHLMWSTGYMAGLKLYDGILCRYELFDYKKCIFYAVITAMVTLDRVTLREKVVDAPEILSVISSIPHLEPFLNGLYFCNYKSFFKVDLSQWWWELTV